MVVFNQRVKSNISMFCVGLGLDPYTPTEDIKNLYRTASIITAYEKAVDDGVTVMFFKPQTWPHSHGELMFVIEAGSHSAEGPLKSSKVNFTAQVCLQYYLYKNSDI